MTATTPLPGAQKVRFYRDLFHSIDELKGSVATLHTKESRWKHRFWAMAIASVLVLTGGVFAITSTTTTFYGASGEVIAYDSTVFSLTSNGHSVVASTTAAAGTTNSLAGAQAMAVSNAGTANTALTAGNWLYQATLTEAGVASFTSVTGYYKAELFQDGTSKGALYVKNTAGTALTTEGIVLKWDIGNNIGAASAYMVRISQVAA